MSRGFVSRVGTQDLASLLAPHLLLQFFSFALDRLLDQTQNEAAVLIPHRELVIDLDAPPSGDDFLAGHRIDRGLVVALPIKPYAALLPVRSVVEIEAMLKEQFILFGDRHAFEPLRRRRD